MVGLLSRLVTGKTNSDPTALTLKSYGLKPVLLEEDSKRYTAVFAAAYVVFNFQVCVFCFLDSFFPGADIPWYSRDLLPLFLGCLTGLFLGDLLLPIASILEDSSFIACSNRSKCSTLSVNEGLAASTVLLCAGSQISVGVAHPFCKFH